MITPCFVALGANLGEPARVVEDAIQALRELSQVRNLFASSLYRTAPVGLLHQPDFINAVVTFEVDSAAVSPSGLLEMLFSIERRFGRTRSVKNAARTLDLDLLLYGDFSSTDAACTLPHPRMHERAFVLAPLHQLAPDLEIPGHGPVVSLLSGCASQPIERLE